MLHPAVHVHVSRERARLLIHMPDFLDTSFDHPKTAKVPLNALIFLPMEIWSCQLRNAKKKKLDFFGPNRPQVGGEIFFKKYFFIKKSCGKFPPRLDKQLPLSGLWLKTLRELSRSRAMTLLFSIFADIALGHPHLNTKKPKILYFEIDPGFGIIRGVGDETVVVSLNLDKN